MSGLSLADDRDEERKGDADEGLVDAGQEADRGTARRRGGRYARDPVRRERLGTTESRAPEASRIRLKTITAAVRRTILSERLSRTIFHRSSRVEPREDLGQDARRSARAQEHAEPEDEDEDDRQEDRPDAPEDADDVLDVPAGACLVRKVGNMPEEDDEARRRGQDRERELDEADPS